MVKVQSYIAKKAPNIEIKGNPNNKSNITTSSKSTGKLTSGEHINLYDINKISKIYTAGIKRVVSLG